MYGPLSLRKNFSWTFVGNMASAGCQWGMLMIMVKLLSATDVGYYALGLAITAPIIMFSRLELRVIHVTDARNLYKFESYFGVRLIANLLSMLVVFGILVALTGRYDFRVYVIISIIALNKIIESTSDMGYGPSQKHDRMDRVAQSMILRNIGALVFLTIAAKLTGNLVFCVTSVGIWWLLVLFFFDKRNVEKFDRFVPCFHPKTMLSILWLGLPLGTAVGILSVNANMSRYFVEAYLGSEYLGYFAAVAYVVVGASQMARALGLSASARLSRYYISDRKAYVRLLQKMIAVAIALAGGGVLFSIYLGKAFLSIVYTPRYAEQQEVFVWLMIAAGFSILASMLGSGMNAARRFKSSIPVVSITFVTSLLASWLLIPRYGMKGAALATLATAVVLCLGCSVVVMLALRSPIVCDSGDREH